MCRKRERLLTAGRASSNCSGPIFAARSTPVLSLSISNQVHALEFLDPVDRYCVHTCTLEYCACHPYILSNERKQPFPLTRIGRRTRDWHEQSTVFSKDNQRRTTFYALPGAFQIEFDCGGCEVLHRARDVSNQTLNRRRGRCGGGIWPSRGLGNSRLHSADACSHNDPYRTTGRPVHGIHLSKRCKRVSQTTILFLEQECSHWT